MNDEEGYVLGHGGTHQVLINPSDIHEDLEFRHGVDVLPLNQHTLTDWPAEVSLGKVALHVLHSRTEVRKCHADIGRGNANPWVDGS